MKKKVDLPEYIFAARGRSVPAALRKGSFRATLSPKGLAGLEWLPETEAPPKPKFDPGLRERFDEVETAVQARLNGGKANWPYKNLDLAGAPPFFEKVWRAMHAVPFGETITYAELAGEAGSPAASRACGQACGKNRIILFIPCHRVLGRGGIGGFGCGLDVKRALLGLEGIEVK